MADNFSSPGIDCAGTGGEMRRAVAMAMIAMSLVATACGAGDTQAGVLPTNADLITTTNPPLDGTVLHVAHEFWHSGKSTKRS